MIFADEYYMGLALSEARAAAAEDEIPIGAIVVAISVAAQTLGGKYLTGCTLYVTVEPCPMCAGAIGWSQLGRIVIGAPDPKRGYSRILRPGTTPFHPRAEVTEGVLEGPCRAIMQDFFINKRNKK